MDNVILNITVPSTVKEQLDTFGDDINLNAEEFVGFLIECFINEHGLPNKDMMSAFKGASQLEQNRDLNRSHTTSEDFLNELAVADEEEEAELLNKTAIFANIDTDILNKFIFICKNRFLDLSDAIELFMEAVVTNKEFPAEVIKVDPDYFGDEAE